MTSPFWEHKRQAGLRVFFGAALIVIGVQMRTPFAGFFLVLAGVYMCAGALTRLIRIQAIESRPEWYRAYTEFNRATLPRQLFYLLLSVAEVDGRAGDKERAVVRQFLLERFSDPATIADLSNWEAAGVPRGQISALATSLRRVLNARERETVFFWCCQVTFADQQFQQGEHEALQQVARGLGIPAQHARLLFHHAKARFLGEGERRAGSGQSSSSWGRPGGTSTARSRAFQILGLEEGATPEQIRKRHRELVKRHHPDAHSHLGPLAAEDAAKRFREIQAAYEALQSGSGARST